ncbi:MAG: hypothetical protein ACE5F1_08155 [Planctomycetota bacterium]
MRPDNERGTCPRENEVILSFLDGEPGTAPAELAEHLGSCRSCARALEESRALDALLAGQTCTEISEEKAERLLAGIVSEARPFERPPRIGVAPALAAGLILALCAGWFLARLRAPELRQPGHVEVEPGTTRAELGSAETGTAGFRVPRTADLSSWRPAPGPVSDAELLRAFAGRRQPRLDHRSLLGHARRLLRTGTGRVPSSLRIPGSTEGGHLGPRVLGSGGELELAAAEWLVGEVRQGRSSDSELLRVGRALLAERRGLLRHRLTELLRREEQLLAPLLGRRLGRRDPDPTLARLVAALGTHGAAKRLARLPFRVQAGCARVARTEGDPRSLCFLLEQYLEASSRSEDVRVLGLAWFDGMSRAELAILEPRLLERAQSSPQRLHRDLCSELLIRLGLFGRASSE